MTLETMQAATERLKQNGVPATLEYPGFIAIEHDGYIYHFGDAAEKIAADVYKAAEPELLLDSVETPVASDCDDAALVASAIIASLRSGKLLRTAEAAEAAFWNTVREAYPEIPTGDLEAMLAFKFTSMCRGVIEDWIRWNQTQDPPRCHSCRQVLAHFAGPELGKRGLVCQTPGCDMEGVDLNATGR
jgi:hypothetical protein